MSSTVAELRKEGYNIETHSIRSSRLADQYNVKTPTYIYVRDGREIRRMSALYGDKLSIRMLFREPFFE